MKTLQFIYEDTEIHFLINPLDNNVMINATEMAKLFDKRIDVFLKAEHTKRFIECLEKSINEFTPNGGNSDNQFPPYGGNSEVKIIETRGQSGTFMHEVLALKFAAWLDVEFEMWVYKTIQELLFGHYKKHWQAHAIQEQAKIEKEKIKQIILTNPTPELVAQYFEEENKEKNAGKDKTKAIKNQIKLFIPER